MRFLQHKKSYYLKRSLEIAKQQKNWQIEKENLQRQNDLKNQYNQLNKKDPYKVTTAKLALWLLFIITIAVIIFIGWVTVAEIRLAVLTGIMPSFAPLTAMVGAILSMTLGVLGYYAKSAKENSKGGITYEAAAAQGFETTQTPLQGCPEQDDPNIQLGGTTAAG